MKKIFAWSIIIAILIPMFLLPVSAKDQGPFPGLASYGAIWHPANGIMPVEDDSCPKGHYRPDGYVYQGYYEGDSVIDTSVVSAGLLFTAFIPGLKEITFILSAYYLGEGLYTYLKNGHTVPGKYFEYVYLKGSNYWIHIVWVEKEPGLFDLTFPGYLTCKVEQGIL